MTRDDLIGFVRAWLEAGKYQAEQRDLKRGPVLVQDVEPHNVTITTSLDTIEAVLAALTPVPMEHLAVKIARAVESDITARSGLCEEWVEIDPRTRSEIRCEWMRIVLDILEAAR